MKIKWFRFFYLFLIFAGSCQKLSAQDVSGAVQEKLQLPFLELTSAQNFEDWNFGVCLFSGSYLKHFPCQFKAGNLSAGGSISKLNNPLLSSTVSPFSTAGTSVSTITASLPGISTYSKPESCFTEFAYLNKKSVFSEFRMNCFYNSETERPVLSVKTSVTPWKKVFFSASATGGYFSYEENSPSTWFSVSNPYYHKGNHVCLNYQFSVKVPHFSSLFSTSTYETPSGKIKSLYKTENKINAGHFTFSLSALYNPEEKLLTSSETSLPACLQTKASIQSTFPVGKHFPLFLKSGIGTFYSFRLSEDSDSPLKFAAGSQLFSSAFSTALTSTGSFTVSDSPQKKQFQFNSAAIQLKTSIYLKRITPSLLLSFSFDPTPDYSSNTTTEKIGFNFAALRNPKLSGTNTFSVSHKDGQLKKQSFSSSFTAGWKIKAITVSGKLSLKFENHNS